MNPRLAVLLLLGASACSERRDEVAEGPAPSSSADTSAASALEPGVASVLARVRALEVLDAPSPRPALPPSGARGFRHDGGARPILDGASAEVVLPEEANGVLRVRDLGSGMSVEARLLDARPVAGAAVDGYWIHARGHASGATVLHRAHAQGTEDHLWFETRPEREEIAYGIDLSPAVAGLRAVENTLELLDAEGAPRLRVAAPHVVGARGSLHPAKLSLEGCAADTDPRGPWGRPVTPPGSATCVLRVDWSASGVAYPALVDPAWTTSGSSSVERVKHTATTLANQRILVAGGTAMATVTELFDPATNTWATTGSLPEGRELHTATRLASGDVLVTGGEATGPALASSRLYGVATGTWSAVGSLGAARQNHGAALLSSGRVLAVGGYGPGPLASAELFDPATATWSATGSLSSGRFDFAMLALLDGRVLAVGGAGAGAVGSSAEIYSPATGSWAATGGLAQGRYSPLSVRLADGRVLVAGGAASADDVLVSSEIYTPALATWLAGGDLVAARRGAAAGLLANGWALAVGGEGPATASVRAELFDPAGGAWATADGALHPRYFSAGAVTNGGGTFVVVGGSASATAERFDLQALGATCVSGGECTSGRCVDSVCCDSACTSPCHACSAAKKGGGANGACGPVQSGQDPDAECNAQLASTCGQDGSCNGAGACRKYAQGTSCGAAGCSNGTTSAPACDGAGTCVLGTVSCAPYVCGSSTACAVTCAGSAQCVAPAHCKLPDGTCAPDQANGAGCSAGDQCQSGHCVDGVCCDAVCAGSCLACAAAKKGGGANGVCGTIAVGTDPDDECAEAPPSSCGHDGTCSGAGSCRRHPAGTTCGSPACGPSGLESGHACDGAGTCVATAQQSCAPFVCQEGACTTSCPSDLGCAPEAWCDAVAACAPDQPTGAPCTRDAQCSLGSCVDGVCCADACAGPCVSCSAAAKQTGPDGVCGPTKAGADPDGDCAAEPASSCGKTGACDGGGSCALFPAQTACGAAQCTGSTLQGALCTGAGACAPGATISCAPYVCAGNACASACASDAACTVDAFCDAGACTTKLAAGAPCAGASACQTGFCVDGVCCASGCDGICQACSAAAKESGADDGECGAAKAGLDPHADCPDEGATSCQKDGQCDGDGACRVYGAGTACGPTACAGDAARGFAQEGHACNGTGACVVDAVSACGSYACALGVCKSACGAASDCLPSAWCNAGACEPKAESGAACATPDACASHLCVDGRCCDAPCQGQCEACDVEGAEGACVPVVGPPRPSRPECPDEGADACAARSCDGKARDVCNAFVGPETPCREASCEAGIETLAASCDGYGNCPAPHAFACSPFVCGAQSCETACSGEEGCAQGFVCDETSGTCRPGVTCDGEHTITNPGGSTIDCAPYRCSGERCLTSCASVDECAARTVCTANGRCEHTAGNEGEAGGCGVARGPAPSGRGLLLLFAACAALSATRPRRRA